MPPLSALLLFALAAGGVIAVLAGLRLLHADWRLRYRLAGGRESGAGARGPGRPRVPRGLSAQGRDRAEIERQLRGAGFFDADALHYFVWLRLAATLAAAGLTFVAMSLASDNGLAIGLVTFIVAGLTYIGAKLALHMRAAERERKLTAEFPFLLDLMLMMLESGVSLDQCFRSIARDERVAVPRHARLVAMLVDDLDRGQDYQMAFDRWAQRVGVSGAKEMATLFRQSLFQGMELVPALREFITEFSQRRVARAHEAIGKITVRMVILMLIFFMPALFVVLAGPPVAAILDTLRSSQP
ncbi:type II secretion system F family protein [Novosphingobium album (ex Liu et al. 2023)]|uniref:Type II secretion system F family protein n=1 Tax=Novosphingobium album (ex Liu et al. 2023) TaxID=3031130 RepID=A0ABT5WNJ9_9SPHN|nr:type II secretion system F family protein [Novosphingobium album (ex Liu et al. 2023)]MDE8650503.1 type II secretion system F family protein [Novosphingobium album (ex Liu et al. 2023)]